MYTLEKNNTSPFCILCMLMPQIIALLTLTHIKTYVVWRVHPMLIGECHARVYGDQIICDGSPFGERKEKKKRVREHLITQRLRDSKLSLE